MECAPTLFMVGPVNHPPYSRQLIDYNGREPWRSNDTSRFSLDTYELRTFINPYKLLDILNLLEPFVFCRMRRDPQEPHIPSDNESEEEPEEDPEEDPSEDESENEADNGVDENEAAHWGNNFDPEDFVDSSEEELEGDSDSESEPEECITDEDIPLPTPPSPPRMPYYQPYRRNGMGPLMIRTPRKRVLPIRPSNAFTFAMPNLDHYQGKRPMVSEPLPCVAIRRISDDPSRFETGGPSHVGPRELTDPNTIQVLARRVEELEAQLRANAVHARRTELNQIHFQEQIEELVRHMNESLDKKNAK